MGDAEYLAAFRYKQLMLSFNTANPVDKIKSVSY